MPKRYTHLIRETEDYGKIIEEIDSVFKKYGVIEIEAYGILEAMKMDIHYDLNREGGVEN